MHKNTAKYEKRMKARQRQWENMLVLAVGTIVSIQSMSGTGRCYDNASKESFFATLNKEDLYRELPILLSSEIGATSIYALESGYDNMIYICSSIL